jgi:hypothetical protein
MYCRTTWFVLSQIAQPLGERDGTLIYRLFRQYMERLPIPSLTDTQRAHISALARQLTETAQQRYEVRRKTTYRISCDLSTPQAKLNQNRLTSEIVRLETELNAAVYDVFGLNEAERAIIEHETKYQYGEW